MIFIAINHKMLMDNLVAMIKVTGTLQKSSEIMRLSNSLVKLPQISQAMREMSLEMTKVRNLSFL